MTDLQVINVGQPETGYLTTESSTEQLKAYFNGLLTIARTQTNEFPVNLEDVWRLVYERKDNAIRSLKRYFLQDVDFQVFRQNAENSQGGRPIETYFLSLACLEFFVARKVRAVFDVYRQVFHKAIRYALPEEGRLEEAPSKEAPVSDVLQWIEGLQKYGGVGKASTLQLMEKIAKERNLPMPEYMESKANECEGLRNITFCLERYSVKCTPFLFNRILMEMGYLVEKSTKKKVYKVIVGEGLEFGENVVPIAYPTITQPLWYFEKFGQLLERITTAGLFNVEK